MEFLPADEYNEIYEKTQVDVDGRMKLLQDGRRDMVQIVKEYVQFTHGIPNFKTLSPKDQSTLLKGNAYNTIVHVFQCNIFFVSIYDIKFVVEILFSIYPKTLITKE